MLQRASQLFHALLRLSPGAMGMPAVCLLFRAWHAGHSDVLSSPSFCVSTSIVFLPMRLFPPSFYSSLGMFVPKIVSGFKSSLSGSHAGMVWYSLL